MKIRKPVVAGKFYPSDKKQIQHLLNSITNKENINIELAKHRIIGGLLPHAGYMFSAYQSVHFFEILKHSNQKFETVVIVNPNHTGYGKAISVDDNDYWKTPSGNISVDKEFASSLQLSFSPEAHKFEHSGEVMLPMLNHFINFDYKIVPITLSQQNYENAKFLAKKIYITSKKLNRNILFIASSDFSHYVNPSKGKLKDMKVIKKIVELNAKSVVKIVKKNNLSICGYGPAACLIEYSKLVSKKTKSELLRFGHSGEIIPSNEVVDYASILFYEQL